LTSGNSTVVAFFDIKGAFDNVHLPSLQAKLHSLGIPLYTCLVLHNLLIDRKTFVSLDGIYTTPRSAFKGLPQGSVLSSILFVLYTADLAQTIPKNTSFTMYADDLIIFATSPEIHSSVKKIEAANGTIIVWLQEARLEISTGKSCFMIFTRSRTKNNYPRIKFESETISREKEH
jgi:hypothetical protein